MHTCWQMAVIPAPHSSGHGQQIRTLLRSKYVLQAAMAAVSRTTRGWQPDRLFESQRDGEMKG